MSLPRLELPSGPAYLASNLRRIQEWAARAKETLDALEASLGGGGVDAPIPDASTTVKGIVELATDGETGGVVAVVGSDSRLSNARAPTGSAGGSLSGTYPNPELAAAADGTIVANASGGAAPPVPIGKDDLSDVTQKDSDFLLVMQSSDGALGRITQGDLRVPAAGVPTMTVAGLTTTSSSSNTVWSDITGTSLSVTAGVTYEVRYRLRTYAAAATTGLCLRRALVSATGTVLGFHVLGMSGATATTSFASREGTVDELIGAGNATSTTTASGSYWVDLLFVCTGSGTLKLQMRSEVSASSVTVDGDGSYMVAMAWS